MSSVILRMALNQEIMPKHFLGKFKAIRIHPIFKALATTINLSIIGIFEGCSLRDFIMGLSVEMSTGKTSFFPF